MGIVFIANDFIITWKKHREVVFGTCYALGVPAEAMFFMP